MKALVEEKWDSKAINQQVKLSQSRRQLINQAFRTGNRKFFKPVQKNSKTGIYYLRKTKTGKLFFRKQPRTVSVDKISYTDS